MKTHLGYLSGKILWFILKMDKGRIQIDGPEDKKVDDSHALTSERWHRLYVWRKEGGRWLASIEDDVK